jgi:hypothetical protein
MNATVVEQSPCPASIDLATRLGRRFLASDLVQLGETWERVRIPNMPKEAATMQGLAWLVEVILDPVEAQFGPIQLTYGFASPELTRHIPGRIDPSRDQHAGYELKPNGKPVCERLGQASDFFLEGMNMGAVALWVATNLLFDRIYFYGSDRHLHVSVGPQASKTIVSMLPGASGKRIPVNRKLTWLEQSFGGCS